MNAAVRGIAEAARHHHHAVCGDEDTSISGSWTDTYQNSQALFLAAIKAAYPKLNCHEIYAVWIDCMESVEYCAGYVRSNPEHAASMV